MLAGRGSAMIAAQLVPFAGRLEVPARSFQGTTIVAAAALAGTPGLEGRRRVASPEPASASSPSRWPW